MCLASRARAFTVDKTSGAGAPDSCPRKVWIPSPSSGVCPVVAVRAFTRLNASEHPAGVSRRVMRRTRRWRWIIVMCRAACVLLALLASACSSSDEASPRPTPTSPTLPTPPIPPTSSGRLQLSGRVLDQNGTPVSGALVEVDYPAGGASSNPPSQCPGFGFCWLVTRTNNLGEYSVEFEPQPRPGRICGAAPASSCGLGFVYSFHDG